MSKTLKSSKGFTLLEVLVALAIFATTALALMKIGMNYTQSIAQNQLRTQAHFIAMNNAADIKINGKWIEGSASEDLQAQEKNWRITQTAFETISPDVQRIEINVAIMDDKNADKAQGISTLSIFNYRMPDSPK